MNNSRKVRFSVESSGGLELDSGQTLLLSGHGEPWVLENQGLLSRPSQEDIHPLDRLPGVNTPPVHNHFGNCQQLCKCLGKENSDDFFAFLTENNINFSEFISKKIGKT